MVTGELKAQVDKVWNAFWSGGIANPMEVIEQITYLLFIKRLDELHTLAESKANLLGKPIENPVFPDGMDDTGRRPRPYSDLRWSVFKNMPAAEMYEVIDQNVFPFIRGLGAAGSSFAANMKDARFTIPTPALLSKVVDLLEDIPMDDRDTKGDIYEYMLEQARHLGAERAVPHVAPHHQAHGRHGGADPAGPHHRPGGGHGGLPGGGERVPARASSRDLGG